MTLHGSCRQIYNPPRSYYELTALVLSFNRRLLGAFGIKIFRISFDTIQGPLNAESETANSYATLRRIEAISASSTCLSLNLSLSPPKKAKRVPSSATCTRWLL